MLIARVTFGKGPGHAIWRSPRLLFHHRTLASVEGGGLVPRRRVVSRDEPSEPEPDVKLIGDAALSVLRAGRAVAGGSGDAGRLHDAYNGLANLAGFPPLKERKNAVALAEKCIALAIDIRSASWAIGCVEQPDQLPAFPPAQGDSDTPEAEVNYARHSLVACAPDGWGTGTLRFALGHVLSVQSPIPAFLYGSLIEDVAKGIQASRQEALAELLRGIQRLPPHIGPPDLGPGGGIGI